MMYGKLCTEFYDADKKFATEDELSLYQEIFSDDQVLFEPMCGSGRLLIPLMELGYEVHGCDNSASMLESLKIRADERSLSPVIYPQSLEDIALKQQYHGIIIPFGSFQLFYPRKKAYNALDIFKQLLLPNGKIVIDCFIPWETLYEAGESESSASEISLPNGDLIKITNHTTANKQEQHMLSKSDYTKYSNDKIVAEESEQMDILWYYQYEMELLLEKHGFTQIKQVKRFLNGGDHITFIANNTG
jgi:SAM-dependent methyltransferase